MFDQAIVLPEFFFVHRCKSFPKTGVHCGLACFGGFRAKGLLPLAQGHRPARDSCALHSPDDPAMVKQSRRAQEALPRKKIQYL